MNNLPSVKAGLGEKITRLLIPAALVVLGMMFFDKVAPWVTGVFDKGTALIGSAAMFFAVAIVGTLAVITVVQNPMMIWMTYSNFVKKIFGFFIKNDFLSYMDRYVEILQDKRKKLQLYKTNISASLTTLNRQLSDINKGMSEGLKRAAAAKQLGDMSTAAHHAEMAATDKESLTLLTPLQGKVVANLNFLDKLDENWGRSIEKLQHFVKAKRMEYETYYQAAKALGQAESFVSGDTEEGRIYQASLRAAEDAISGKIAYIDEFMKNSEPVLRGMALDKTVAQNDGLKMLDEYMNDQSLFLPEDFTAVTVLSSKMNEQQPSKSRLLDL